MTSVSEDPPQPRRHVTSSHERSTLVWADIRELFRRYKLVVLGAFLATVLSTYVTVSLLSDQYEASSQLLVKMGRENLDPPVTARTTGPTSVTGLRREDVVSELLVLRSPDLAGQVVDEVGPEEFRRKPLAPPAGLLAGLKFRVKAMVRVVKEQWEEVLIALGLQKRLSDREKAVLGLMESLAVEAERDSDVLTIRLRMPDPQLAVHIQERLIALYLQHRLQVRQDRGVKEYLDEEVARARKKMSEADAERMSWKRMQNLSSTADQKALLLRKIRDMSEAYGQMLTEAEGLRSQIQTSERLLAQTPRELRTSQQETPSPQGQLLREGLTKLKMERSRLLVQYQVDSERVRDLDQEIARLSELAGEANARQVASVTHEVNPAFSRLEQKRQEDTIQREGLRAKAVAQKRNLEQLEVELRRVDNAEARLGEIEREWKIAEENYLATVKRQREANISAELDLNRISNVSVLSRPAASPEPVSPRKKLLMGLACVLGLLLGVGLSLVLEYMSDRGRDGLRLEEASELSIKGAVSGADVPAKLRSED